MGRPASTGLALCAASSAMERLYGADMEVGVGAAVESRVESGERVRGRWPIKCGTPATCWRGAAWSAAID